MAKILVIDDDDSVRHFTARAIAFEGHETATASDGLEGLELIRQAEGGFDLILSDIRMPAMDGIELAKSAHAEFPGLRLMLMTGYAEQRERAADLEHVVIDVISKPFSLAEMRKRVNEALFIRRAA